MSRKRDIAWNHVDEVEVDGKKLLKCRHCEKSFRGGVHRLKQHLAGVPGDIASCEKIPTSMKQEVLKILHRAEKTKKSNQLLREENIDHCTSLTGAFVGSSAEGGTSENIRKLRGPMDRFMAGAYEDDDHARMVERNTQGKRIGLSARDHRDRVNCEVARFFYNNAIPFNFADSDSFLSMMRAVGNYGIGYKPPSRHELSTTLLQEEVQEVSKSVDAVKKTWAQTGVSILSDGWKDTRGRQLINFVVNNPYGNVYLHSIDASDMVKDANLIFSLLDEVVEEVGEEFVVQVVTDNAANYKKAGKLLMEKRSRLWWTPCAAHCMDLILEDIGKLPRHKIALTKAKKVIGFIYNHSWVLALMRKYAGKDLIRPAATRFATGFLTLQRLVDLRGKLEQMFTSSDWNGCTLAAKPEGGEVKKIILRDEMFWEDVIYALNTTEPLVKVLRLADSEKVPGMGFLYGAIDEAKEVIASNVNNDYGSYVEIWNIIDKRWEFQIHRDLHAAAYFLNPRFQYAENKSTHPDIKKGLINCITKMIVKFEDQAKAMKQQLSFIKREGLFGIDLAKEAVHNLTPSDWWVTWGDDTPELKSFAVKVLSLTCSSSACERNWSMFNWIHTKRRNRLTSERLNDMVYVAYNKKLQQRRLKKVDDEDCLVWPEMLSDDEWIEAEDDNENSNLHNVTESSESGRKRRRHTQSIDEESLTDLTVSPHYDPNFVLLESDNTIFQGLD